MKLLTCPIAHDEDDDITPGEVCGAVVQATHSLERYYTVEDGNLAEQQHLESSAWSFYCDNDHNLDHL